MRLLQITAAAAAGGSNGSALDPARPQEMLKIFRETQENMMELNRSRLAALEEVKTLRARVALLGANMHCCKGLLPVQGHSQRASQQCASLLPNRGRGPGAGAGHL
jgi:hypothetical protein